MDLKGFKKTKDRGQVVDKINESLGLPLLAHLPTPGLPRLSVSWQELLLELSNDTFHNKILIRPYHEQKHLKRRLKDEKRAEASCDQF